MEMSKYKKLKSDFTGLFHTLINEQKKHPIDAISLIIDDEMQDPSVSKFTQLVVVNITIQLGLEATNSFFLGTLNLLNTIKSEITLIAIEQELSIDDAKDLFFDILKTNALISNARVITDSSGY